MECDASERKMCLCPFVLRGRPFLGANIHHTPKDAYMRRARVERERVRDVLTHSHTHKEREGETIKTHVHI